MKRTILLLALVFSLAVLAGCQKPKPAGNEQAGKPPASGSEKPLPDPGSAEKEKFPGWVKYENEKYSYSLKRPPSWFFLEDACCPPPPAYVNFNNYSSKKAEYAAHQMEKGVDGIDIGCLYEGVIGDIGEVQLLKKEGTSNRGLKINGFDAIRFERDTVPGDPSEKTVSYYIVDGKQGCRVTLRTPCQVCEDIVSTFAFD